MKVYQEETNPVCVPDQSESGSVGSADPHWTGPVTTGGRGVGVIGYILKFQAHQNTKYAMHIYAEEVNALCYLNLFIL